MIEIDKNVPIPENLNNSEKIQNSNFSKNGRTKSQLGKMARNKGQRGEREVLKIFVLAMQEVEGHLLWQLGHYCALSDNVKRNTMQSDRGGFDLHGIPLLAPEVKYTENKAIGYYWQQCLSQAKRDQFPCLFYRSNNETWKVRSYASLQMPHKLSTMQWIVADYDIHQFIAWYKVAYRQYLLSQLRHQNEVSPNIIFRVETGD